MIPIYKPEIRPAHPVGKTFKRRSYKEAAQNIRKTFEIQLQNAIEADDRKEKEFLLKRLPR
jgi:hypothetical protein